MSTLFEAVPPVLPDILAAAGLILVGISFFRGYIRYRNEERRLRNSIRELQNTEELKQHPVRPGCERR